MKQNAEIFNFFGFVESAVNRQKSGCSIVVKFTIHWKFQTHLPGFVKKADELKSKGVAEIFCISINDPFVMAAWGKDHSADGKVKKNEFMHMHCNGSLFSYSFNHCLSFIYFKISPFRVTILVV